MDTESHHVYAIKKIYSFDRPASTSANIKRLICVRNSLSAFDHLSRPKHPISFDTSIYKMNFLLKSSTSYFVYAKIKVFQRDGSRLRRIYMWFIFDKLSLFVTRTMATFHCGRQNRIGSKWEETVTMRPSNGQIVYVTRVPGRRQCRTLHTS